MSSMNSLAEVGVGINLAFSLISGIRDSFFKVFDKHLDTRVSTIQTILNDMAKTKDGVSSIAVKVEDIKQRYSKTGQIVTNIMVIASLLAALSLIWFLCESAICSSRDVSPKYAYLALCFAIGPIIFAGIFQVAMYYTARFFLELRLKKYNNYIEVATDIYPQKPTS